MAEHSNDLWRAVFEIASRRNGISAKELQRIMGFGSYKTAWGWLHKIRSSLMRPDGEPLGQGVEIDEAYVGSKRLGRALVLVAAESGGRVRLALAENNDEATVKRFADTYITPRADITTDGLASYNARSLGERQHEQKVQTRDERRKDDALQTAHWVVSLLKRWLLGTHGGAVKTRHLQSYLDEFEFRYNRRKTNGATRLTARAIEQLVEKSARTMKQMVTTYVSDPSNSSWLRNASAFLVRR